MTSKYLVPVAALALVIAGCRSESGNLRAERTGDLSHPKAARENALAPFEACGTGASTALGAATLGRSPYLQQTTPTSTKVLWTSRALDHLDLEITVPERAPGSEAASSEGDPVVTATAVLSAIDGVWRSEAGALRPNTIHCYGIRSPEGSLVEGVGFRTAPEPGTGAPARFVVLGDSGEASADQYALLEQIPTVPFDFMLHTGDIAYDSGTLEELETKFFDVYEKLLRHFPIFPVPGNHEYETDDAAPYRAVFDLPNNERYYSFDWGDVHFVALDTEKLGEAQTRWLEKDLAANDKAWTIAFLHKPPYSSSDRGSDLAVRAAFEPLFDELDVDLVLAGHEHHYERLKPQRGVHYIVTGGGGAGTYDVTESEISAFAEEVIHFLYVTVDAERLSVHAIDATGQEFDQLVVER